MRSAYPYATRSDNNSRANIPASNFVENASSNSHRQINYQDEFRIFEMELDVEPNEYDMISSATNRMDVDPHSQSSLYERNAQQGSTVGQSSFQNVFFPNSNQPNTYEVVYRQDEEEVFEMELDNEGSSDSVASERVNSMDIDSQRMPYAGAVEQNLTSSDLCNEDDLFLQATYLTYELDRGIMTMDKLIEEYNLLFDNLVIMIRQLNLQSSESVKKITAKYYPQPKTEAGKKRLESVIKSTRN